MPTRSLKNEKEIVLGKRMGMLLNENSMFKGTGGEREKAREICVSSSS